MKNSFLLIILMLSLFVNLFAKESVISLSSSVNITVTPEFEIQNGQIISNEMLIDNEPNYPKVGYYYYILESKTNVEPKYIINHIEYKTLNEITIDGGDLYSNNRVTTTQVTKNRENLIDIKYIKNMRGKYLYSLRINPFKYSRIDKKLSYIKNLNLVVNGVSLFNNGVRTSNYSNNSSSVLLYKKSSKSADDLEIKDFSTKLNCDYLIVTNDDFENSAKKLCFYRDTSNLDYVINPKYVKTSTIYSIFEKSVGEYPKATAIKTAIDSINKLSNQNIKYVVLLGSGYLETNNLQRKNYIPIFSFATGINLNSDYPVSDDDYVRKSSIEKYPLSISIGRLPARSVQQAENVVDKIIYYQKSSRFGDWKNRVLFVADDDKQGSSIDYLQHEMKLEQYSTQYIPGYVDLKRLYMYFYPIDPVTGFKPTATSDLISFINNGLLALTYSGHGGSTVMADERLFTKEHLGQLRNRVYPIINLLSCSIGKFRDEDESLGEALTTLKDYGTIFVFAASNETFATQNNKLGGYVYKNLFNNEKQTIGDLLMMAKSELLSDNFASVYNLFGDPASVISLPKRVKLTKKENIIPLNNYSVDFNINKESNIWNYSISVFDAYKYITYQRADGRLVYYYQKGGKIYSNNSAITSNYINESFIVPKNVSIGDSSANYYVYVENGNDEIVYYQDSIPIVAPDSGLKVNPNLKGPTVSFYQVTPKFNGTVISNIESPVHNGDELKLPVVLQVKIYDSKGLYLNQNYESSAGYGGLAYQIDNGELKYGYDVANQIDKSNIAFSINLDSSSIDVGNHVLRVWAVNLLGGVTFKQLNFSITDSKTKILSRMYITKSPGKPPFRIVYYLLDNLYAGEVVIYNQQGRVIKTIYLYDSVLGKGVNSILWDGKLESGKVIGSGLYIAYIKVYKDFQKSLSNSYKFKFIVR